MDKIQKEVEKQLLNNEQEILDKLKQSYAESLADIKKRIKELQSNELTQSKIYQIQYQQNLEKQINGIIDILANGNINSINDYLAKSYTDGFIGTVYHMQSEGLPFIMPLNQATILKSISKTTEDFKLSTTLYKNAEKLKTQIISEITRGLSQNYTYGKIAQNISGYGEADFYKSYRIARTEGGRVQTEAKYEAMTQAKENGADVVKQWDSTLDERTRTTHAMLDGQIKEIDEQFEVDGKQAMYPHGFGIAEEDINCRCALLERARWAVEDEKDFTKMVNGDIVEFADVKDYQDFKQQYFNFYDNKNITATEGEKNVQYIGKLDKNKLGGYADLITVDDVVLTDERRFHILEDHEKDYNRIMDNLKSAVINPNEVIEDVKNTNTLMFIGKLEKNNLNVIVKLNTTDDKEHPQNSIMTAWIIRDSNLNKLRKKNKTIYKNE